VTVRAHGARSRVGVALALSNAATAEARRLAHARSLAVGMVWSARLHSLVGNDAALDELAGELIALTTERGFPVWHAAGTIFRGWAKVKNWCCSRRDIACAAVRALSAPLGRKYLCPIILPFSRQHTRSRGKLNRPQLYWVMRCR
jgi:hypothetical protein